MNDEKLKRLYPSRTIGIIGGGQLGRMIVFEAKRMGYKTVILDPTPDSPAGQVADEQIVAGYSDLWALSELARKTDVITYEFEHINVALLSTIENDGYTVCPSSATLKIIQNKFVQKNMLKKIGVQVPDYCFVDTLEALEDAFYRFDRKIILKTCRDGYDGKGNIIIKDLCDLKAAYEKFGGQELIVEAYIDFIKEVSIVIAKSEDDIAYYPIAENLHKNSILIKSLIPAKISDEVENTIHLISQKIVETFNDVGIFCIEFFVDKNNTVLVNEIAPRPHNSGHYTIEACVASQFEQLLRIICKMPLGPTKLRKPCVMYNILGPKLVNGPYTIIGLESLLAIEDCHFHLYGKAESRPFKKIGHITVLDDFLEVADEKGKQALNTIEVISKI